MLAWSETFVSLLETKIPICFTRAGVGVGVGHYNYNVLRAFHPCGRGVKKVTTGTAGPRVDVRPAGPGPRPEGSGLRRCARYPRLWSRPVDRRVPGPVRILDRHRTGSDLVREHVPFQARGSPRCMYNRRPLSWAPPSVKVSGSDLGTGVDLVGRRGRGSAGPASERYVRPAGPGPAVAGLLEVVGTVSAVLGSRLAWGILSACMGLFVKFGLHGVSIVSG